MEVMEEPGEKREGAIGGGGVSFKFEQIVAISGKVEFRLLGQP
jgi:hypothetical protein